MLNFIENFLFKANLYLSELDHLCKEELIGVFMLKIEKKMSNLKHNIL